jgi:hypothetical protein
MTLNISSASDFQEKHREQIAQDAEALILPSGLTVRAHRPSPDWWIRHLGRLPQGLAVRTSVKTDTAPRITVDEMIEYAQHTIAIISETVVEPRVRLNPSPNDIDPNWIADKDFQFILAYARGEIAADGQGLERFPRGTAGADAGPDGKTVGAEAK